MVDAMYTMAEEVPTTTYISEFIEDTTNADPVTIVILRHRTEPTKYGPRYRTAYAARTMPAPMADRLYASILVADPTSPLRGYEAEVHPSPDTAGTVEHVRHVYGRRRTYRMAWPITEGE